MATFLANRAYDKALDVYTPHYDDIVSTIRDQPPEGYAWLFVARRRGRKTWTLKGVCEHLGSSNARVIDCRYGSTIEPVGTNGYVHLIDEPSDMLREPSGVKKFLSACRAIHSANERILLALTPQELRTIRNEDPDSKHIADVETRVPFPQFSETHARLQAKRSAAAEALLDQLLPEWVHSPFLLELIFEIHAKDPNLDLNSLWRAVLNRANQERYLDRVLHDSLNPEQRKLVLNVAYHVAASPGSTLDYEWLTQAGYLKPAPASEERYCLADPVLSASLSSLRIHHLSDPHFGQNTALSIDDKSGTRLGAIAGQKPVRDEYLNFVRKLKVQGQAPHLIVVSGDIGERSAAKEYPDAQKFFEELRPLLADHPQLDYADRILLVGGNHDVERSLAQAADPQKRHQKFANAFPRDKYPRPELELDPARRSVATVKYADFDLEVLLLGSAEAGQEVEEKESWGALLRLIEEADAKRAKGEKPLSDDEIEKAAIEYARIDPGLVHAQDLDRAQSHSWSQKVKIAVLHHPVSPLPSVELARYTGLLNAGRVKEVLFSQQFALVLHGHLHAGRLLEERWNDKKWTLRIASAPSLGSNQINEKNGFNEIHIQRHFDFEKPQAEPLDSKPKLVLYRRIRQGGHDWAIEEQLGPFSPGESSH